jgi:transcription-repair coupling factor (superfamily II helicase)
MALRALLDVFHQDGRFRSLATAVAEGGGGLQAHVSGALQPYLLAALAEAEYGPAGRPLLVVAADDLTARDLCSEVKAYVAPRRVHQYPSRGVDPAAEIAPPPHLVGLRIAALDALLGGGAPLVVAGLDALGEPIPDPALRPSGFSLRRGEEIDLGGVARQLVDAGYERVEQVEERGQFALRGGILDVYPATEERAVRIELFGDEVESLRSFSTFTQRSFGDVDAVELDPAAEVAPEHAGALADENRLVSPLELLPAETAIVLLAEDDAPGDLRRRAALTISSVESGQELSFRAQRAESPARTPAEAEGELEKLTGSGYRTVVAFERQGEAERARYNLQRLDAALMATDGPAPREGALAFAEAALRDGFVAPELKLAVIPYRRLVHRRRPEPPRRSARGRLTAFSDLRVGDYVVHEDHGIARFAGFETREVGGVTRDYLYLEYRGDDRVFVPTDQLAKLSRYVGADGRTPQLSALGGKRWDAIKSRARRAAQEMAGELIALYAERRARPGHPFAPDGEYQLLFERAFPYRETPDQLDAIDAVKADMEAARPMDRLICGDVGYGKTEVALRAAHKAAADGKQVMLLVPTTILAQQHFGSFRERFAELPYTVEMVSRLRKPAETKAALKAFAEGRADVLIGTHRLLSRDVRAKDLGLLIVDEEQRFGVKQKELLRRLKLKVDVLSMSATPIPRTLQMSLAGLRDISVIETPPEGRRPIHTYVGPYDDELVQKALERERARGGQAFFLHNRIETLHETAERLRALCPGIRIAEVHGRMDEGELEETMLAFIRGEADCLVTTTIIEAGLDIPRANTLIVERADALGLAQAYQIRGRVGRSRERAYAYLLYPSDAALSTDAAARLATLSDYTELGSGFRIAMRDLEIRGAGHLLGEEQSGHVAAVGFELYCALLDEAVEELRAEGPARAAEEPELRRVDLDPGVDAYIPADYIAFEAAKIDVHRRIAMARGRGQLTQLREELEDRFGPLPEPVENLFLLQEARLGLQAAGPAPS